MFVLSGPKSSGMRRHDDLQEAYGSNCEYYVHVLVIMLEPRYKYEIDRS